MTIKRVRLSHFLLFQAFPNAIRRLFTANF
jgi:hypothetical protein